MKISAFALLFFVVASIIAPLFAVGHHAPRSSLCLTKVRQQALGQTFYAADHDARLTPAEAWMDGIAPYVRSEAVFHDIDVPRGGYGYAFNRALSHAKPPKRPESTPMLYDSTDQRRNASDAVASLPPAGRHKVRNIAAYADGHARALRAGKRP